MAVAASLGAISACGGAKDASSNLTSSAGVSSAPRQSAEGTCDLPAWKALEANGDLDGQLALVAACKESPPEWAAKRLDILVELGEIDQAKELARAVAPNASPVLRGAAERALAASSADVSFASLVADARDLAAKGSADRTAGDPASAGRKLARARHLFRRATGSEGRLLRFAEKESVGWSGGHPVFGATLAAGEPRKMSESFLVATEIDRKTPALRMVAAAPAQTPGSSFVPWPGRDGAFLSIGRDSDGLVDPAALIPFKLPAGQAAFSSDGRLVAIATSPGLEVHSTADGAKRFVLSERKASGRGRFLANGSYVELGEGDDVTFVVDAQGKVVFEAADRIAAALSPSEKYLALLHAAFVENVGMVPSVDIVKLEGGYASTPVPLPGAPAITYQPGLEFEGDVAIVTLSTLSAMMTEGQTWEIAEVDAARAQKTAGRLKKPLDRRETFAAITKLAKPSIASPRQPIGFHLHSATFDRDAKSGISVIVTGIPDAFPSSVQKPNLLFIDARGKVLANVPLTSGTTGITSVSIAPGGESVIVCTIDGSWLVDRAKGVAITVGGFEDFGLDTRWSSDGAFFLTNAGVLDVRASGVEQNAVVLPLDTEARTSGPVATKPSDEVCWFAPVLAPREVCPSDQP